MVEIENGENLKKNLMERIQIHISTHMMTNAIRYKVSLNNQLGG